MIAKARKVNTFSELQRYKIYQRKAIKTAFFRLLSLHLWYNP